MVGNIALLCCLSVFASVLRSWLLFLVVKSLSGGGHSRNSTSNSRSLHRTPSSWKRSNRLLPKPSGTPDRCSSAASPVRLTRARYRFQLLQSAPSTIRFGRGGYFHSSRQLVPKRTAIFSPARQSSAPQLTPGSLGGGESVWVAHPHYGLSADGLALQLSPHVQPPQPHPSHTSSSHNTAP
jgi:hypothetical protein